MSDKEKAIGLFRSGDRQAAVEFLEKRRNELSESEFDILVPTLAELYIYVSRSDDMRELVSPYLNQYQSLSIIETNIVYSQYLNQSEGPEVASSFIKNSLDQYPDTSDRDFLTSKGNLFGTLGQIHSRQNHLDKALEVFQSALATMKDAGNQVRAAAMQYNIAGVMGRQGKYTEAIGEFEKVIEAQRENENILGVGYSKMEMGGIYEKMGELDMAMASYQEEYEIFKEHGGPTQQAWAFTDLGNGYLATGDPKKAMEYYQECLPHYLQAGDAFTTGNIYTYMSSATRQIGSYEKAIEYATEAKNRYTEIQNNDKVGQAILLKIWALLHNSENSSAEEENLMKLLQDSEGKPSGEYVILIQKFHDDPISSTFQLRDKLREFISE